MRSVWAAGGMALWLAVASAPLADAVTASATVAEAGTLATVAGPGFCPAAGSPAPDSQRVGGMAVDSGGRVHFDAGSADAGLMARIDHEGRASIVTVRLPGAAAPVGTGRADGEPATRLAVDGGGGVLRAAESAIVQVAPGGAMTTVSGDPTVAPAGRSPNGDGGPARGARWSQVRSLATDENANVFAVDRRPKAGTGGEGAGITIRYVNRGGQPVTFYPDTPAEVTVAPGAVDTIVGADGALVSPPSRFARNAVLAGPAPALAVVGARLYLAFSPSSTGGPGAVVQVVNLGGDPIEAHGVAIAPGEMTTVAGRGAPGYHGDDGPARDAAFSALPGISVGEDGSVYLADEANHRVRRVDPTGRVTTLVGTGAVGARGGGFNGNDRAAIDARLDRPVDVKVGPAGQLYLSDSGNGQIRFVDPAGVIHASLGNGLARSWACDGAGEATQGFPAGVAVDVAGDVYVAAAELGQVKRLSRSGDVTTVAGRPRPDCREDCATGDGGPASDARLVRPRSIALTVDRRLYIYDEGDARVRLVNLGPDSIRAHGVTVAAGAIATVAGSGATGDGGDGGPAVAARLSLASPLTFQFGSVAADDRGNLLIADLFNHRVRQVGPDGIITTLAGGDVKEALSCCGQPSGLAVDAGGNVYVGSSAPPRVWFLNRGDTAANVHGVSVAPSAVEVVAGSGVPGFAGDGGPATEAQLTRPAGLVVDHQGNLYVADSIEHTVRRVDPAGRIETVAGAGMPGFNGDGLKARLAALNTPNALALDRCGNLLIADSNNDRVRRLNFVPPCGAPPGEPNPPQGLPVPFVVAGLLAMAGTVAMAARRRLWPT